MRHVLAILAALAVPLAASAQGFVESVSPPVIERGKSARVTFVGKDLGPGLDVWHSLPKGALTAKPISSEPGKLVFEIHAAKDAPVGVCGLRVATRDGLTNAVLFHVEDLPVLGTVRAADKPVPLVSACSVWGTFGEGTLDRYAITVGANERVSFECVSNRLGKDADPLLTVRDASGKFVAECDNDPGLYFDFRFAHTFEKAGTYTLEVRDARLRASEHHNYILRIGKFPAERVVLPSAVSAPDRLPGLFVQQLKRAGDTGSARVPVTVAEGPVTVAKDFDPKHDLALAQATSGAMWFAFHNSPLRANPFLALERSLEYGSLQSTPAAVPGVLCGTLKQPGRRQCFAVRLEKGQRIYLRAEAKQLNSPADLEVTVVDRTGRDVARSQENGTAIWLDFTAPAAGTYGIAVRDTLHDGSDSHTYQITVRDKPFPPAITADVEGLTVPRGNYQIVPLAVARNGQKGDIKLALLGAPSGVKLTPDTIAETENAAVCKLEADGTAPVGLHTVQIVAECGGEKFLVRTRPLVDKRYQNVDLIPIALREDQTRLPPALTDRFAVQVTPPSPFTFELPEKTVTLPRYQSAPIPVVTTRVAGFDGPISFHATGGQLADKNEGRTRVYAEFPEATAKQPSVSGVVVSKILSNIGKVRIEVTATGTHEGRRVTLIRTFELDLTYAYTITTDTPKVALLPGESAKVRYAVSRVKTFDGPVTLHLNPVQGIEAPETVTIPKGQTAVEFAVKAAADAQPRKQNWQLVATADVGGFEEELRASPVEIETKKVEVPKKK